MDAQALHHRARTSGVNPVVYAVVRAVLLPFFRLWFRLERHGRGHIPAAGPLLLAANHRSFLDPFVIGAMVRRPVYYVAKKELFAPRWQGRLLNALGAFPVDRGSSDHEMLETARQILRRGDAVVIFPEGTRIRAGGLATPKRGVGRLALETGAPVVPIAVTGTEHVRRGWRIRPRRVRLRAGRPLTFPRAERPSPRLAQAVTDRIWPCVALQWEWLGGTPPVRRAVVLGAGPWGTAAAVALDRAGAQVALGARSRDEARALAEAGEHPELPGVRLDGIAVRAAAEAALEDADLVVLAAEPERLPHLLAAHGERIGAGAGVLVLASGAVPPLGTEPAAFVAERVAARAVAVLDGLERPADLLAEGAEAAVAGPDRAFAALVVQTLRRAGTGAVAAPTGGRRAAAA